MGQPAITKALKEVEDIFATELFERASDGLRLTEAGAAVLAYAESTLSALQATSQKLGAIASGLHGCVRLGVIPHAPEALLAAAMGGLLSESPRLSLVVKEAVTADLATALRAHELDCAIGRALPRGLEDGIRQEPIFEQTPSLLVTPKIFDRLAKRPLDWRELSQLDWILQPANTPMRQTVDTIFIGAGVPPPVPAVETASLRAIECAFRSLPNGVTVLASDLGERLSEAGVCRVLPYSLQWNLPPICLLVATSYPSSGLGALLDSIRDAAKQLAISRRIERST